MMNPDMIKKFEQHLANFIETGNKELLNWFMELNDKYKSNLLDSDIVRDKFWTAFIQGGSDDTKIFRYLISSPSKDTRSKMGELFASLIKTKQQNQYSPLLTLFIEQYTEWPMEIVEPIQNACIEIALEIGAPNDIFLLSTVFRTLSAIPEEYNNKIIEIMTPRIASDDISLRNNALGLLKLINEKINHRNPLLIQECMDAAKQLLDLNNSNAKELLEYILNYADVLNKNQVKELIELVKQQLTETKPIPIITMGLTLVQTIITTMDKRDILGTVLDLIISTQDEEIKNTCRHILKINKLLLTIKQEEKMTEIFGNDWFSDKQEQKPS